MGAENEIEINDILNILEKGPQFKKEQALKKLIALDDGQHIEIFRKHLLDKDWHLRLQAAWGLGKFLGKEALAELTPLLNDKAFGVREDVSKIINQYCS